MVLIEPNFTESSDAESHPANISVLWGMVTDKPSIPSTLMAINAGRASPVATGKATYAQSSPDAAKAALCSVGDNEWRTGSPTTPATRVWPEIARRRLDTYRSPRALARAMLRRCSAYDVANECDPSAPVTT